MDLLVKEIAITGDSDINLPAQPASVIDCALGAPEATTLIGAVFLEGKAQLNSALRLLQSGCDTEICDGGTALHHAVVERQPEMFELLMDFGADVDCRGILESQVPLISLAITQNSNIVRNLLFEGCDPNAPDANGDTPLHYALRMDKTEIARKLRTFGGKMDVKNCLGLAPSDIRKPVETPTTKFEDFGFDDSILRGIYDQWYKRPSPIQQVVLGPLCRGTDLAIITLSGSGRTAALAISAISRTDPTQQLGAQSLVVCCNGEVACSTAHIISQLGAYRINKQDVQTVIGGEPILSQEQALSRPSTSIVVGTPGRLCDLLDRGFLNFSRLSCAYFDGFDDQINLGWILQIVRIMNEVPHSAQVCMTMNTYPTDKLGIKVMNMRKLLFVSDSKQDRGVGNKVE